MRLPVPDVREYFKTLLVFVGLLAFFQYTGLFFRASGSFDVPYLVVSGLTFLVVAYSLSAVAANTAWLSSWDRMNRTEEK